MNRRPKGRAARRRKKKKAEPIVAHSVYQASVVSTHGSGAENDAGEVKVGNDFLANGDTSEQ